MKVTGNSGIRAARIYNENKVKGSEDSIKAGKKYDSVEISKAGMEIARYVSMAKEMPDVRSSKVEDIKSRIESGKYSVSSDELASRILDAIGEEITIKNTLSKGDK
jgi:negative regulator of flagellin synthesis FlgM